MCCQDQLRCVCPGLFYCCYDEVNHDFNQQKVSQLAQLDWVRSSSLWQENIVRLDVNPKDPAKPYKLSTSANAITDAVKAVKYKLQWI